MTKIICSLKAEYYVGYKNKDGYSLAYILRMSRIIWAMKKLNYTDGLVRIAQVEQSAMTHMKDNKDVLKEDNRIALAISYVKDLVDSDLPE